MNSHSPETPCVTFRILFCKKQVAIFRMEALDLLVLDWYFRGAASSITVGQLLRIKPPLVCVWFCLCIFMICIYDSFTCTAHRMVVVPYVFHVNVFVTLLQKKLWFILASYDGDNLEF